MFFFFFQAEDGIRDPLVTGVQTCALPIWASVDCAAAKTRCAVWARTGTRRENAPHPSCANEFSRLPRQPLAPSFSESPRGGARARLPGQRTDRRTPPVPGGKREIPAQLPDETAPENRSNR